jgi:hypothetical protein
MERILHHLLGVKTLPLLRNTFKNLPLFHLVIFLKDKFLLVFLINFFVNGMLKPFLGGIFFWWKLSGNHHEWIFIIFNKWIGAILDLEVWVVENCFQFCVCVLLCTLLVEDHFHYFHES